MNYMYYFLNVSENTYKLQIPYASKVFKKKNTLINKEIHKYSKTSIFKTWKQKNQI